MKVYVVYDDEFYKEVEKVFLTKEKAMAYLRPTLDAMWERRALPIECTGKYWPDPYTREVSDKIFIERRLLEIDAE